MPEPLNSLDFGRSGLLFRIKNQKLVFEPIGGILAIEAIQRNHIDLLSAASRAFLYFALGFRTIALIRAAKRCKGHGGSRSTPTKEAF
jgi:hypothetical protein